MKKLYEGMFLFDSNLATKDWPGLEHHVQDLLQRNAAELVYSERWPDRKLSYEIKGCKKGTYYLTYFNAEPDAVRGLRRDCQLSERVLRVFVLYDESFVEECKGRVERAAAVVAEETPAAAVETPAAAVETPAAAVETPAAAVETPAAAVATEGAPAEGVQNVESSQTDLAAGNSS